VSSCSRILSALKNFSEYSSCLLQALRSELNRGNMDFRRQALLQFLSDLDLDKLQKSPHFAKSETGNLQVSDLAENVKTIHVVDCATLRACIDSCAGNNSAICFQVRRRDLCKSHMMSWSLLQLCCKTEEVYQLFLVYLPSVLHLEEEMKSLLACLSCKTLVCFNESSWRVLHELFVLVNVAKPDSNFKILQKSISRAKEISFKNLVFWNFGKVWDETWKIGGWDNFPLQEDQIAYAVMEVLALFQLNEREESKELMDSGNDSKVRGEGVTSVPSVGDDAVKR
jgi:hypothetical protein